jgi:Mrp family chromosome partitioning ATPase
VFARVTSAPATADDDLEEYRRLLPQICSALDRTVGQDDAGCVLLLASTVGEAPVAQVASNLARAAQSAGKTAVVVNADTVGAEDGEPPSPQPDAGPTVDSAEHQPQHSAEHPPQRNGHTATLPLGAQPTEAVESIDRLRGEYEYVIVAAPAELTTSVATALNDCADGFLVVLSLGTTRRVDLDRTIAGLRSTGARAIGVLLADERREPADSETGDRQLQTGRGLRSKRLMGKRTTRAPEWRRPPGEARAVQSMREGG